jgi:hypothetical protein
VGELASNAQACQRETARTKEFLIEGIARDLFCREIVLIESKSFAQSRIDSADTRIGRSVVAHISGHMLVQRFRIECAELLRPMAEDQIGGFRA